MTKTELFNLWTRYMHRTDLSADLETVYTLAKQRINERLMRSDTDLNAILLDHPLLFLHAGMLQLAELTQDDVQIMRETQLFEQSVVDFAMNYSIRNVQPIMARPYYSEAM